MVSVKWLDPDRRGIPGTFVCREERDCDSGSTGVGDRTEQWRNKEEEEEEEEEEENSSSSSSSSDNSNKGGESNNRRVIKSGRLKRS